MADQWFVWYLDVGTGPSCDADAVDERAGEDNRFEMLGGRALLMYLDEARDLLR